MTQTPSLPTYNDEDLAKLSEADLFDLLARDEDRLPRNVIDEAVRRGEAMVELLAGLGADPATWAGGLELGPWWRRLHAVMILGLLPSESAGLQLVSVMRRMSDAEEEFLQDWCAGSWPALFRNKPAGIAEAVHALGEDRELDWYRRANAIEVVVDIARRQGVVELETALDWVAAIMRDESENLHWRQHLGNTLLDFPRPRHRGLLEELEKTQKGFGRAFHVSDIERAYGSMRDDDRSARFDDPWEFYDPDAIDARQRRWEEEDAKQRVADVWAEDGEDDGYLMGGEPRDEPYIREMPKIGRNDLAPVAAERNTRSAV